MLVNAENVDFEWLHKALESQVLDDNTYKYGFIYAYKEHFNQDVDVEGGRYEAIGQRIFNVYRELFSESRFSRDIELFYGDL